jgi:hypothetical protein
LIRLQRLRLSARPIQREHHLRTQALAKGVLTHEPLELAHERRLPALREILLDALLEAGKPELLEAGDLRLGEALIGKLGQRRPAPERECLARALLGQALEAIEIELALGDPQAVARCLRREAILAERSAQLRDVHLKRLLGRLRRCLLPDGVDQAVGGDDLVRVQEQNRKQGALLRPAQIELPPVLEHLEGAEDQKLHSAPRERITRHFRRELRKLVLVTVTRPREGQI